MFNSFHIPGQLLVAQMMSALKGHEVSYRNSKDRKEFQQAQANLVSRAKLLKEQNKAQASKKGTLA